MQNQQLENPLEKGKKTIFKDYSSIKEQIKHRIHNKGAIDCELDTEYYDQWNDRENSETISSQIKFHDVGDEGVIYTHNGYKLPNYPHRKTSNILIDHFNHFNVIDGYGVLNKNDKDKLFKFGFKPLAKKGYKKLVIDLYTFFGIVDITRAFYNGSGKFIDKVIRGVYPNLSLVQNKRLETQWQCGENGDFDFIPTPWVIKIEDVKYIISIRSMDISAMLGADSYANYAKALGIELPDKELMDEYKSDMRYAIKNHPELFGNYALGDLHNRAIYRLFQKQIDVVCETLAIPKIKISLTIGSTVNKILVNYFQTSHNIAMKKTENFEHLNWHLATAQSLKQKKSRTRQWLGKVDGGRCHNNKPFVAKTKGEITDIDIKGCYTDTMRSLDCPFGEPVIIDYPKKSTGKVDFRSQLFSLGQFLDHPELGGELISGMWIMRVSTPENYKLKHPQDLIASFIPSKKDDWKTKSEKDGIDVLEGDNSEFKLFTNEIKHGLINSDILEVLQNYSNSKAWKEYRENIFVETAIYYPKSERVLTPEEYLESINNDLGSNEVKVIRDGGKLKKITIESHNHCWFSVPLEKVIDLLQKERKKYPKSHPLNRTFKLIGNTIYGVSVSDKFKHSNVVLANNITARARTMAWCMEKGLNMFQTITDGGMFNPKQVITNGQRKITVQNLVSIKSIKNVKLSHTEIKGDTKQELEQNALKHLSQLFSKLSIFQQQVYQLEIKTNEDDESEYIANGASFHGSADYLLNYPSKQNVKMRSCPDKKLVDENNQNHRVREEYMNGIFENPKKLKRMKPRLEITILKTKDYVQNLQRYDNQKIKCGQSIVQTKQFLEFSLNQFTFQTLEQYKSWEKEIEKLKRKSTDLNYGQSLEMFYTNDDGTLDYERMINEVYHDVITGKMKPRCMEEKSRHLHRKKKHHPYLTQRQHYRKIENPDRD